MNVYVIDLLAVRLIQSVIATLAMWSFLMNFSRLNEALN